MQKINNKKSNQKNINEINKRKSTTEVESGRENLKFLCNNLFALRVCLDIVYFAETEKLLLKVL